MKTWYSGCPHFGHVNMVRGVTKWTEGYRDFNTVAEHNKAIADAINKYVSADDELILLGDVRMGLKYQLRESMQTIVCKNITLVYGNHDDFIRENKPLKDEFGEYLPQSLFTRCVDKLEIVRGKKIISCDHYPYESWRDYNKSNLDGYMFHSHVHGQLHHKRRNKRIDVGMDSSLLYFGEYRPFEESEAIELSLLTT